MARPLREYDRKRDFTATPEPRGEAPPSDDEAESAAASRSSSTTPPASTGTCGWSTRACSCRGRCPAGCRGIPGRNHLAVHTEDHPLEYLEFEGHIPDGNYGAGHMFVWDRGTYMAEKITDDKVVFTLAAERARGRHALFQTDGRNWMIHRMDPPADPDRRHPPDRFPAAPVPDAGPVPRRPGRGWAVEAPVARPAVAARVQRRVVDVLADGHFPVTDVFPEVRPIGRALGDDRGGARRRAVAAAGGAADRLHRRLSAGPTRPAPRSPATIPMSFVAVDLLWKDGHPAADRPWHERRDRLEDLALAGPGVDHPGGRSPTTPPPWSTPRPRAGLDEVVPSGSGRPLRPGGRAPVLADRALTSGSGALLAAGQFSLVGRIRLAARPGAPSTPGSCHRPASGPSGPTGPPPASGPNLRRRRLPGLGQAERHAMPSSATSSRTRSSSRVMATSISPWPWTIAFVTNSDTASSSGASLSPAAPQLGAHHPGGRWLSLGS